MSFDKIQRVVFGPDGGKLAPPKGFLASAKAAIIESPTEFLAFLIRNAPNHFLSLIQFRTLCLLLNFAVNECSKISEFVLVSRIYAMSSKFGTHECIQCKSFFLKNPVWNSEYFWIESVMFSLSVDLCKWKVLRYLGTNRKSTWNSLSLHSLNSNEVLAVIVLSRIQAFAITMRSLGLGLDKICDMLSVVADRLELNKFGLDWKVFPARSFVTGVLDSVVDTKIKQDELHLMHESAGGGLTDSQETLGFSALVEILLSVETIHALRHSQTLRDFANETPNKAHSRGKKAAAQYCLCGHTLPPWSVVGTDNQVATDVLSAERPHVVSVLCERCCRLLLTSPLNAEVDMTYCGGICPIYTTSEGGRASDFQSIYSLHDAVLFADTAKAVASTPLKASASQLQEFGSTVLSVVRSCPLYDCGLPSALLSEFQTLQSSLQSSEPTPTNRLSQGSMGSASTADTLSELPSAVSAGGHAVPTSPTPADVLKFVIEFWRGVTVNIVYAGSPTVEKTRVVYFRTGNARANEELDTLLASPSGTLNTKQRNAILDAVQKGSLFLCWARRSERDSLQFQADKSIDMDGIKHVKVGANKWKNCINIAGAGRTMVIKVVDEEVFERVLGGLLGVVSFRGRQLV